MQSVKQIWAFDNLGITVIWGGKLSLWSEIAFYRDATAELKSAIYDHKTNDLHPNFQYSYTYTNVLLHVFTFKTALFCITRQRKAKHQLMKSDVT